MVDTNSGLTTSVNSDVCADPNLRLLVERIIPADDYLSGWEAGVGDFIRRILATDLQHAVPAMATGLRLVEQEARVRQGAAFAELAPDAQDELITALLARETTVDWSAVAPDEFIMLLVHLSMQGFYGDPQSGGNHTEVSWRMIGYKPLPDGATWPPVDLEPPSLASWESIATSYDAVVVGSGAGGGIAACVLAEAGHRVLLVERGPWLATSDLRPNHIHNQRSAFGYDTPAGPPTVGNPRVSATVSGDVVVPPTDRRWNNNAMTAGGGTRVYGAQAWRFAPEDFRMASTYGVPEGSSLADWPISYEELEPDYDRAEWELGVCGDPVGDRYAGPRKRGYPMPPLRDTAAARVLRRGAAAVGINTAPVPLLINSVPYNGRGACINCGTCVGFGCPGEFKNDSRNTVIPRAVATGRCDVLINTQVERIVTDEGGAVTGVALVTEQAGAVLRRQICADQVVLGAGAVETARLLLNSASAQEPAGVGNNTDQVGRNLQGHVYSGTFALFDEPVQDCVGPGPRIATNDYRHGNPGVVGGALIANDFVATPINVWAMLSSTGAIPLWGAASKRSMREAYSRMMMVMGPIQEMPSPESRVTVAPDVRDKFGIPVARLSGGVHSEDFKTARFIRDKAVAWAQASGASAVFPLLWAAVDGPSGGQHQAGTCRMGTDPATSVTDRWGAVWGHPNLHIVDGSLHVTNGGVNPVLTIMALAYRVSRHVAELLNNTHTYTQTRNA